MTRPLLSFRTTKRSPTGEQKDTRLTLSPGVLVLLAMLLLTALVATGAISADAYERMMRYRIAG